MTTHKHDDLENEDWDNGYAESMAWRESQHLQQQPWMSLQKPKPPPRAPMKTLKALLGTAVFVVAVVGTIHYAVMPAATRSAAQASAAPVADTPASDEDFRRCVFDRAGCEKFDPPKPAPSTAPSKMQFTLAHSDSARWITAEGDITADTPANFRAFVQDWGELARFPVRLNSRGGDVLAGVLLGELFRQGGFSTEIGATDPIVMPGRYPRTASKTPGTCTSACAWSFLGGISRTARPGELGLHQFWQPALSVAQAQAIDGALTRYLKAMDIDPEVLVLAAETPPEEMTMPDAVTMNLFRITH